MAQEPPEKTGPWADELLFKIYLSPEPEYLALKTGEINIMDWELPAEKVTDALAARTSMLLPRKASATTR